MPTANTREFQCACVAMAMGMPNGKKDHDIIQMQWENYEWDKTSCSS